MKQLRWSAIRTNIVNKVLFCILLFSLLICIIFIKDYGLGYDEIVYYNFGDINFHVIKLFMVGKPFDSLFNFYDLRNYGSAYLILGGFIIQLVKSIFSSLNIYDAWHILNFIVFLSGAQILYTLCKRFVSEFPSFFASLLYLTQPLLWGHGL